MSLGGEELGTITFRVVDAGSAATPSQSPGAVFGRGMPSQGVPQRTIVDVRGAQPRTIGGNSGGFNAAGIASVIAQSTTNPFGSAVGAATLAGGSAAAAPLLLVGAVITAEIAALYGLKKVVENLTARIQDVGRFAPSTMQAIVAEKVADLNRTIYRARAADAEFSALQRQLTSFRNRLTPVESLVERKAASASTYILERMEKGIENGSTILNAISIFAASQNKNLAEISQNVQAITGEVMSGKAGGDGETNSLVKKAVDIMTGGRVFGTLGPIPPVP